MREEDEDAAEGGSDEPRGGDEEQEPDGEERGRGKEPRRGAADRQEEAERGRFTGRRSQAAQWDPPETHALWHAL